MTYYVLIEIIPRLCRKNVAHIKFLVFILLFSMLFTCPPSELVAFVSETLAFSGRQGVLLPQLWIALSEKLGCSEIDAFQKSIIWRWMVHSGQKSGAVDFFIMKDREMVSDIDSYENLISNGNSESAYIVLPTEEAQWQHLTHQRYSKRLKLQLGEFPFQLLCEIASHGKKGIFASELSKVTGQDPRSMTPRLRKLEESGYIVKRGVYNEAASQHTSVCIHMNFADTEVESAATDFDDDFESSRNVYKLKQFIILSLKSAPNHLRGFKDLKIELNLHKDRSSGKFFRSIVEALHKRGYAERVLVKNPDKTTPIYCIRYIKDLPKDTDEISDFVDLSRSMKEETQEDVEDDLDALPSLNQYFPLANQLILIINTSGEDGSTSMNLVRRLTGTSDFRPIVKILDVFSTFVIANNDKKLLKPTPDPFQSMSISRAYDFAGKFKFYRYFVDSVTLKSIGEPAYVTPHTRNLKQINKSNFRAIGRVPPGPLLSIKKRKISEARTSTKRTKVNRQPTIVKQGALEITIHERSSPKTKESVHITGGSSLKASRRRTELLNIIKDLGGVAYTTANLCRQLDSRLGNTTVTDKKTLARDVSTLIADGSIYVENVEFSRSGQNISRKLLILKQPEFQPSEDQIEKMKQKCIEDVGNRTSSQMNRRIIDGEVIMKNKKEGSRLSSLSNDARSVKLEAEDTTHVDELRNGVSKGKKEKKKATLINSGKSIETQRHSARKAGPIKFDSDDENTLFRAVVISKTFHRSIDFSKIASLWGNPEEKSIRQRWSTHRKAIGGQSTVARGIKTFEGIVMSGIENGLIGSEELSSINLKFFLDLWNDYDVTTTAVAEKEPLYYLLTENLSSYKFVDTSGLQSDTFEQIEDCSMRQKEATLAKRPFYQKMTSSQNIENNTLKTVIRAIISTDGDKFDPKMVAKLLEKFNNSDVENATAEMLKEKEIIFQENANFKFLFSEKFQMALHPKSFGVSFLDDAGEFANSLCELSDSSKGLILSQAINGSNMAVLLTLLSRNKLSLWRVDRPYKLNGYESRLIDKNKLSCDLIVKVHDSNLLKVKPSTKVPTGKAGSHLWLGIDGGINVNMWKSLIASLLSLLVFRPGIDETALFRKLKHALEIEDVRSVVNWLIANDCLRRLDHGSFYVSKRWIMVFGY